MQPLAAPPAASLRAGAAAGSASPWPGHRRSYTRTARQPLGVAAPSSSTTAAALRQTLGAPIPLNEARTKRVRVCMPPPSTQRWLHHRTTPALPFQSMQHAVSVTMPKWSHVVGYEEGDPAVTDRLVLGYPRFVYHPFVKQLVEVRVRTCLCKPCCRQFDMTKRACDSVSRLTTVHPWVNGCGQVWKQQAVERGELEAHEEVGALPFPSQAAAERYACIHVPLPMHTTLGRSLSPPPLSTHTHSCRRFLLDAHAHEPGFPVRVHSLDVADAHMVSFPAAAAGTRCQHGGHACTTPIE